MGLLVQIVRQKMFAHLKKPNGGASKKAIAALEATHRIKLPADYKLFLEQCGGGSLVENSVNAITEDDAHFEIRQFYGLDPNSGGLFSDLDSMQDCYEGAVPDQFFVIGSDYGGNLFVFLLASPHTVFWWDHETGEKVKIADNFSDLLERVKPTPPSPPECDFTRWSFLPEGWQSEYGRTVCECAAISGRLDIVKQWADLKRQFGESMRFAAMNGHLEIVDLLISFGENINKVCSDGRTPLDWASYLEDQIPLLRERGALLASELSD